MSAQMQDNLSYMKTFEGLSEKEKETLKKGTGRTEENSVDSMYNM